jgi:putative transcriptional regulator
MTMLQAKRKVEELLQMKQVFIKVPTVEDQDVLAADLATAGIAAAQVEPPQKAVDVRLLRERLGLTREQFAIRFGLEIETVRN